MDLEEVLQSGAVISLSQEKLFLGWGEPKRKNSKELDPSWPAFYFNDFFLSTLKPWMQYPYGQDILVKDFYELLQEIDLDIPCDWKIREKKSFQQIFQDLLKELEMGQLDKAVLYLFATSSSCMTKKRLQNSLRSALSFMEKGAGYLYGCWDKKGGVLGLTPEVLFFHSERDKNYVKTMALAGTCSSSCCQKEFLVNEKERKEHQYVIDSICTSLEEMGEIEIGKLQLLHLPHLTHLMTPIHVQLFQPFQFDAFIERLHPTAALGAFPKEKGKKWLENFQKHTPRKFFGAPIGICYPLLGLSQSFVGIRNVEWNAFGMRVYAGCGVVKESVFEKEWGEICLKIQSIQKMLKL